MNRNRIKFLGAPVALVCAVIFLGLFDAAESVPRFSAEQGMECGACHFAPGGGAIRNRFGHFTVSVHQLSLKSTKVKLLEKYKEPKLGESVTVGADARWRIEMRRFADTTATDTTSEYRVGSLSRYQSDIYLAAEPFSNTYLNFTLSSGSIDESYLLYDRAYEGYWIQAGRFYPQYGLRLEDFTSLVRQRTGIFHRSAVDGLAFGTSLVQHNLSATFFTSGQQSVYLLNLNRFGWVNPLGYFYGLSLRLSEKLAGGGHGANPALKGAYAGIGWRNYSLVVEGDLIGESNDAYAIYVGASAKVIPGLYGKLDYNFYDPDRRLQSGAEAFMRISAELWPIPFVEVNPGVTIHTDGPFDGEEVYDLRFHLAY